jgi:glycerophosphoryl diester phosphodiesterase
MLRPFCLVAAVALAAVSLTAAPAAAGPRAAPALSRQMPVAPVRVADIAHRGASAYAPENTLTAFRLAQAQQADMFELDVQETRDHELVLMHDTTLARTTNVEEVFPERAPWQIRDFTLAEIRMLDAGSWFDARFQGEAVPTLGDALRAMRGSGLGLLLEIKAPELYPGVEQRVADALRREPYWLNTNRFHRRLVVQAFNWNSMRLLHGILPWVPIGVLGTPAPEQLPRLAAFAAQINPNHRDLSADYVARIHAAGMDVFTWTAQDATVMRQAIAYGVDGVITDRPDVLRAILSEGAQPAA